MPEVNYAELVDQHAPLQPGIKNVPGLGEYTVEDIRDLRQFMTPIEREEFDQLLASAPPRALMAHQIVPWDEMWWEIMVLSGGRGTGKTVTGAFAARQHLWAFKEQTGNGARIGVGAPTNSDARDTCAEGDTGLITMFPGEFKYNRSLGEARHTPTGGYVKFMGTEKPKRWNGPQWSMLWFDELALCNLKAWHDAQMGLRLGPRPRAVCTTTPKMNKAVRALTREKTTYMPLYERATGRLRLPKPILAVTADQWKALEKLYRPPGTTDNPNLPEHRVLWLLNKYGGTRLGRQELEGLFIEDVSGAAWKREWIKHETDPSRWPKRFLRIIVAVDPAGSAARATSDENALTEEDKANQRKNADTAICVAAKGPDGYIYILALYSGQWTPDEWATRAVRLYHQFKADKIIAEKNYGGLMVESTIRNVWREAPVKLINASRGKDIRAEPVTLLYEQGQIIHCRHFAAAEDQMCAFINAKENEGADLVDADVWAVSELMGYNNIGQAHTVGERKELNQFRAMTIG